MRSSCFACVVGLLLAASPVFGTSLYSQDFEVASTASWTVNNGPSDAAANFFFDYSTVGIPAAPGGTGTRGMKLQANLNNGVFGGMSASPIGQSFTGNYTVEFDWWENWNGPFPGGGNGSTNMGTYGIGTAGATTQWPGGVQDSVWFAGTGDGGSAQDWRAYSSAAATGYLVASGVYAFPSQNNTNAYFATTFPARTAPAAQLALYAQQTGSTAVGSGGMAWHHVVIAKVGTTATWKIDNLLMATIDLTTVTLGGGDIFFGHSDVNVGSSTDPLRADLLFTLIDNVLVTPEPGSLLVLALGLLLRRR